MIVYLDGMRSTFRCLLFGHKWRKQWAPVGHIEDAEWRPCLRQCDIGQMRQP